VFLWQSRALDLHAGAFTINGAGETTAQAAPIVAVRGKTRARGAVAVIFYAGSLARSHTQRGTAPPNPTSAAFCERSLRRKN